MVTIARKVLQARQTERCAFLFLNFIEFYFFKMENLNFVFFCIL